MQWAGEELQRENIYRSSACDVLKSESDILKAEGQFDLARNASLAPEIFEQ